MYICYAHMNKLQKHSIRFDKASFILHGSTIEHIVKLVQNATSTSNSSRVIMSSNVYSSSLLGVYSVDQ